MFWGTQSEIAAVVREVPAGQIRLPDEPFRKKRGTGPEAESVRALADGIRAHETAARSKKGRRIRFMSDHSTFQTKFYKNSE